jgi:hypothetical protein
MVCYHAQQPWRIIVSRSYICPICSESFTTWNTGFDNLHDHILEEHKRSEIPDALEMIELGNASED